MDAGDPPRANENVNPEENNGEGVPEFYYLLEDSHRYYRAPVVYYPRLNMTNIQLVFKSAEEKRAIFRTIEDRDVRHLYVQADLACENVIRDHTEVRRKEWEIYDMVRDMTPASLITLRDVLPDTWRGIIQIRPVRAHIQLMEYRHNLALIRDAPVNRVREE